MDLYYIILTLCLILLILITALVDDKKKGYGYFLIILFVFLVVHRYVKDRQKKELFVSRYIERFVDTTEATDALAAAVAKDNQIVELQNQVKSLEKDIGDLTDVVRQRALNTALDDTSEARDFSLLEAQKKQDQDLEEIILKYKRNFDLNISLQGEILPNEMDKLYLKCHAMIFPSKFESFGLTLLEALAAGTQVICSNIKQYNSFYVKNGFWNIFAFNFRYVIYTVKGFCVLRK